MILELSTKNTDLETNTFTHFVKVTNDEFHELNLLEFCSTIHDGEIDGMFWGDFPIKYKENKKIVFSVASYPNNVEYEIFVYENGVMQTNSAFSTFKTNYFVCNTNNTRLLLVLYKRFGTNINFARTDTSGCLEHELNGFTLCLKICDIPKFSFKEKCVIGSVCSVVAGIACYNYDSVIWLLNNDTFIQFSLFIHIIALKLGY